MMQLEDLTVRMIAEVGEKTFSPYFEQMRKALEPPTVEFEVPYGERKEFMYKYIEEDPQLLETQIARLIDALDDEDVQFNRIIFTTDGEIWVTFDKDVFESNPDMLRQATSSAAIIPEVFTFDNYPLYYCEEGDEFWVGGHHVTNAVYNGAVIGSGCYDVG